MAHAPGRLAGAPDRGETRVRACAGFRYVGLFAHRLITVCCGGADGSAPARGPRNGIPKLLCRNFVRRASPNLFHVKQKHKSGPTPRGRRARLCFELLVAGLLGLRSRGSIPAALHAKVVVHLLDASLRARPEERLTHHLPGRERDGQRPAGVHIAL